MILKNKKNYKLFLPIIFLNVFLSACIGLNKQLASTGTLADRLIKPSFNVITGKGSFEEKLNDGSNIKIPLVGDYKAVEGFRNADTEYILKPHAMFQPKGHLETVNEEVKKSSITGKSVVIPVKKLIKEGYFVYYTFSVPPKLYHLIDKVELEILNSEGKFELIHNYTLDERMKQVLAKHKYYMGSSEIIIEDDNFIHGDRNYTYIFKITVKDVENKILDSRYFMDFSRSHDRNYHYVRGYLKKAY